MQIAPERIDPMALRGCAHLNLDRRKDAGRIREADTGSRDALEAVEGLAAVGENASER